MIEDWRPRSEKIFSLYDEQAKLDQIHSDLLDYQEKLDDARERADGNEMTQDELNDLSDDLKQTMPDAVRRQLPGYEPEREREVAATADPTQEAELQGQATQPVWVPGLK